MKAVIFFSVLSINALIILNYLAWANKIRPDNYHQMSGFLLLAIIVNILIGKLSPYILSHFLDTKENNPLVTSIKNSFYLTALITFLLSTFIFSHVAVQWLLILLFAPKLKLEYFFHF